MLQDHGDDFQKRVDEDVLLQVSSQRAIEEVDSGSNSRLSQVLLHLKNIISKFLEVDENGQG